MGPYLLVYMGVISFIEKANNYARNIHKIFINERKLTNSMKYSRHLTNMYQVELISRD